MHTCDYSVDLLGWQEREGGRVKSGPNKYEERKKRDRSAGSISLHANNKRKTQPGRHHRRRCCCCYYFFDVHEINFSSSRVTWPAAIFKVEIFSISFLFLFKINNRHMYIFFEGKVVERQKRRRRKSFESSFPRDSRGGDINCTVTNYFTTLRSFFSHAGIIRASLSFSLSIHLHTHGYAYIFR